jgi:hypothetical protein
LQPKPTPTTPEQKQSLIQRCLPAVPRHFKPGCCTRTRPQPHLNKNKG